MNTFTIGRPAPLRLPAAVAFLALIFCCASSVHAQPAPDPGNLGVFTSPIDVTGLPMIMRISAPDRETGQLVDVPVPPGLLPPAFAQLLGTPLNVQFDNFWNVAVDATGKTVRAVSCDGIATQVAARIAQRGDRMHDFTCDLATSGEIIVQQTGPRLDVAYLLRNNTIGFQSTSTQTCSPENGSVFCPNDPRFTVKFAVEIVTSLATATLCSLNASNGEVFIQGAQFDTHNLSSELAQLFAPGQFLEGEAAMNNSMRRQPLPIDAAFRSLRQGDLCAKRLPGADRTLFAFRDFEAEIDMRRGIVLHATHSGILPPVVSVAQSTPTSGSVPSFFRPMISTAQPLIKAGDTVALRGQHFPSPINLSTQLPVGLEHDSRNPSVILGAPPGGVCFNGGGTDLEFGPVGGALRTDRLAATLAGACAAGVVAKPLTPSTAYQFRARDCDPFTCSPWSPVVRASTTRIDRAPGAVGLELDRQVALGGVRIDGNGNFDTPITIPPGTPAGAHTIRAATRGGTAVAEVVVQVTAPGGASQASIMMVGLLSGESGCPNHPITSTQTDDTFQLFGAGFAAGSVIVNLDNAAGVQLGNAVVRPDGSICQQMRSPAAALAGPHAVVAVQGGAIVARTDVTFVAPSGPH